MATIKSGVSSFSSPNEFLGGCGAKKSNAPRRSLRASWIQPAGEELSLESLGLNSSKQGLDALLQKDNLHASVVKDTPLMADETERTAHSSGGDFDFSESDDVAEAVEEKAEPVKRTSMAYALDDFLPGSEPKATKKWTPPKKEEETAPKATHMAGAYAQDSFLPGSEPKPIKKWTPPKKVEESSTKATHMAGAYAQDSFLPGSEPKPIKKWTPPPKEAPDSPTKRRSSLYDNQTDFIGGCEPKPIKKWTPPPKDAPDSPTKRRSSLYDNQTGFLGGCEPKEHARRYSSKAEAAK